jgi:hypothetical protein
MDEAVALRVKVQADEKNTSVSRHLGDILRTQMERDRGYATAMHAYLAHTPAKLRGSSSERLPLREELYDRRGLR